MDYVIAIDGPAGAGKSTVARILSSKLGYKYLDTGAMYRALTYLALKNNIDVNDIGKLTNLANETDIDFIESSDREDNCILVNNEDVTDEIRTFCVNKYVSEVAKVRGVREAMVRMQRDIAREGKIVMDGRDIGSRVLPTADFKFYITASLEERTKRRYAEIKDNEEITLEGVKKDIINRDQTDKNRKQSPLVKTEDAILIDTTDLSIEEVVDTLLNIIGEGAGNG